MEVSGLCVGGQGELGKVYEVYELRDGEATGKDQRTTECCGLSFCNRQLTRHRRVQQINLAIPSYLCMIPQRSESDFYQVSIQRIPSSFSITISSSEKLAIMSAPTAPHADPFRHTCLIPYVEAATAPPHIAEKINVLPFRRNIFLLLAHSPGLFPHMMGLIGGYFNKDVRKIPLLDWVSPHLLHHICNRHSITIMR